MKLVLKNYLKMTSNQLGADPVDSGVARCAYEHLSLALEGFYYGFHECGCLAGTRWTMDYSHFLGFDHVLDSQFLTLVEPRKVEWWERAERRFCVAKKHVTQVCKMFVFLTFCFV